jgi:predicted component of viral defense system (DUF524 family)
VSTTIKSIEKSKRIATSFYTKLGSISSFGKLDEQHSLANSLFSRRIFDKTKKRLLPLNITNSEFVSTTNTVENRFIKFFLEEINSICLRIINSRIDIELTRKASRLQSRAHQFLLNPFFNGVQRLKFIPSSSSVLLKKPGYSEIYYHFVQSKFSFRPILENQEKLQHKAGLKNIATLYEIWVFFKIAICLFGKNTIEETFNGQVLKNGSLIGSYTWSHQNFELYYNKSYTKGNKGSYSVTLRPDVSLLINKEKLFLFDAKYKFNSNYSSDESDGLVRIVKPEDIHKMHAYLDAIPTAIASIVVYPGTETIFHYKTIETSLNGVGAVPLTPQNTIDIETIIEKITR